MIESFIIYDRLGCLKDKKGAWSSAMFLEFWNRAKIMVDFIGECTSKLAISIFSLDFSA